MIFSRSKKPSINNDQQENRFDVEKEKRKKKEGGQNEKRNPLFEKKQPLRRAVARVTARVTDCKTME